MLPPCTDQGTSPYQGLVMPFNYRSNYYKLYLLIINHFFQIIALIFDQYDLYLLRIFMGIHYDYKSTKSAKLMEKQAKREKTCRKKS